MLVIKPDLIEEASKIFGSQSIVVSLDAKKTLFGKYECWIKDGSENTKDTSSRTGKKS